MEIGNSCHQPEKPSLSSAGGEGVFGEVRGRLILCDCCLYGPQQLQGGAGAREEAPVRPFLLLIFASDPVTSRVTATALILPAELTHIPLSALAA